MFAGVIGATVATHLIIKDPLWAGVALGLCNGAEALIIAGLIHHYFGTGFNLVRLRYVFGLLAATVAATIVSGIGGAVTYRLMRGPSAPMFNTWQHWFASDAIGIIAVAPLVIGLTAVARRPSPRSEVIEGVLALLALAAMTVFVIFLPRELWETVWPITWLLPILLWLAARDRPAFSAAGAFVVSTTIVWTTILGIGHFGEPNLPITNRVLGAQAAILVVALSAYVLAALFAERREHEANLARANTLLEHEQGNKLMNIQAAIAVIAHELRQPLSAMTTNASAAQRWLARKPPDQDEANAALNEIKTEGHRVSEMLDGFRSLFGNVAQERRPVDINDIVSSAINSLEVQLKEHGVQVQRELTPELPLISGHSAQLREVVYNLVNNAVEAMRSTNNRSRVLRVRTERRDSDAITVAIQDSGPGIDPSRLGRMFGAFVTTRAHGTGLGLAICRIIVEQHGGNIAVSSDESGALFQFVLPIAFEG
jgi:signal transduction histidine kinase